VKKPSYRKLKQMLADAETAFRQVQSNNLDLSSEILRLRETVNKRLDTAEARVKELEAKIEAVRLVIR